MKKYNELRQFLDNFPVEAKALIQQYEFCDERADIDAMYLYIRKLRALTDVAENVAYEMMEIIERENDRGM